MPTSEVVKRGVFILLVNMVNMIPFKGSILSFCKGCYSVPYAKEEKKGSTEAPFISILRIQTALTVAAT